MTTPSPSTTCPKCSAKMEFGLVVDSTWGTSFRSGPERVVEWVRGTPKRSWWDLSFKTDPRDRLQVCTLRCTKCAYLELYAPATE